MANRNSEQHFANIPRVDIKRSIFDLSHSVKTTINEGEITPIFLKEILPGDTFDVKTNFVLRMTTPVKPVMDNAYIDLYYFFVPNRLVWDHWKEFMGENKTGAWDESMPTYKIPGLYGTTPNSNNSLITKLGIPKNLTIAKENAISAIPCRDYALIYNEYFRNQNVEAPLSVGNTTDSDAQFNGSVTIAGGSIQKAYKFADYFTNALPGPQKGDPISVGLTGPAPVAIQGNGTTLGLTNGTDNYGTMYVSSSTAHQMTLGSDSYGKPVNTTDSFASGSTIHNKSIGLTTDATKSGITGSADLSQALININDIRNAFAVQRQLEKDARAGTRYIEIIKANFGVTSSDARMQRPEYLGGGRYPINMMQVLQTSSTDTTSAQGNTAAFSNTCEKDKGFLKSFEEHGYIMGLAVIRTDNTYYQGIEKHWSRKDRFDFYFPTFANIGEQPILNKEIFFANDTSSSVATASNNEVYGYQEAWAEYRYAQNKICGEMMDDSQKIWNYAEKIASQPYLNSTFLKEGTGKIDQTLTASSALISQFRADFYHNVKATRPMPVYSVPGLIDHN